MSSRTRRPSSLAAAGQVTLTANVGGISAQVQVNILAGTSLPPGTVRWSAPPVPGFTTVKILQAVPASANTPDLYSIEANDLGSSLIRTFTGDGRQMWQKSTDALGVLVDATPDGFGGALLRVGYVGYDRSLVDLDGVTGTLLWQYTSPAPYGVLTGELAIAQDGKVFSVETEADYGGSSLLALDGMAGQPRFRASIPHSTDVRANFWCDGQINSITQSPAATGRPAVGSDGSVYVEFSFSDQSHIATDCSGGEPFGSIDSFTNTLSLFHVLPDGSSSASALNNSSQYIGIPGIVIPDGQGGALASWGLVPVSPDPNYVDPTRVTHVGTQGTNVHFLPLAGVSAMVLGENGVAFATDTSAVLSFDANSGQVNWTYQAPTQSSVSIIASLAGNGLVAKLTDPNGLDTVLRLDSNGQPTAPSLFSAQDASPWSLSEWVGTTTGSLARFFAPSPPIAGSSWPVPGGNLESQNASPKFDFELVWCEKNICASLDPTNPDQDVDFSYRSVNLPHPTSTLTTAQAQTIRQAALSAFEKAFAAYNVTAGAGRQGTNTVYVVGEPPDMDPVSGTLPCASTNPINWSWSRDFYLENMSQVQFALNIQTASATPTQDVLEAIGRGIGNNAAHEIAHQLDNFGNIFRTGKRVAGLHDTSINTYNGGDCDGGHSPWVYTGIGPDGTTTIHWGSDTDQSLQNILGKKN